MNKPELIDRVSNETGLPPTKARQAVEAIMETIVHGVRRGPVVIPDFGTFSIRKRCARKGCNPRTGEPIDIPPSTFPVFIPGKALVERVNRGKK